jgi:hypothetical protein
MSRLHTLGAWALAGAAVLTTSLVAGPAAARTVVVSDGRDVPASADLTSATYRDGEARVEVTAHVRALRQSGRVVALVGAPDSDTVYYATVWPRPDGTVGTRLELVTDVSRSPRPCALAATWSVRTSTVEVSVPQSCLRFGRFLEQHYVQVRTSANGGRDAARGVDVGRGSSPGCATAGEIRGLRRGDTKARVHALLDTAGRFGDGAAGGYSRIYRSCSGGRPWYVDYDGTTDRLEATGRVRGATTNV